MPLKPVRSVRARWMATGTVIDNDADDDGVCDWDEVVGCQDDAACNYNAFATDAGACELCH